MAGFVEQVASFGAHAGMSRATEPCLDAYWCLSHERSSQVTGIGFRTVLGVDWTSLSPYKELAAGLVQTGQRAPPYVFMNYRCAFAARRRSGC